MSVQAAAVGDSVFWLLCKQVLALGGTVSSTDTVFSLEAKITGLAGTQAGPGGGDMLKSVYDVNNDGFVDHAALADTAPWTGITGKPSTFPPDATAELVARKGVANGYAGLDATGKVPAAQLPAAALISSSINAYIETPTAKTYTLELDSPVAMTLTKITLQLTAGTCTVALLRNGSAVSGATAISVSTTISNTTVSQVCAVDDNIAISVTSPSSAANLSVAVRTTQ